MLVTTHSALAASPPEERAMFARIAAVEDYTSSEPERAASVLADRYPPARIASSSEYDVIRAATLRDRYEVCGQDLASALAYRDKLRMREASAAAAIKVPRFRAVRSVAEVIEFAEDAGFPVVVKPRFGMGAGGIHVVTAGDDVRHLSELGKALEHEPAVLAEQYVNGPLYHVDGVALDGKVIHSWPSRYSGGALDEVSRGAPRASVMLASSAPERPLLQDFAARVVSAFPGARASFGFHMEAWIDATGAPVLCEIASRAGTETIVAAYQLAFGLNLFEASYRAQAGLPLPSGEPAAAPRLYTGWVTFLAGRGVFAPPDPAGRPATALFETAYEAGRRTDGAQTVADVAARSIVTGASAEEATARVGELVTWWNAHRPWR